jgi:hypothetical protein
VNVGGADVAERVDESDVLVGARAVCPHLDDGNLDDPVSDQGREACGLQVDDGEEGFTVRLALHHGFAPPRRTILAAGDAS